MGDALVLSLFPGIGLLDMAFEEEGFCVVRGPDLLWGGDVRRFSPPAGRFDGVIGGPPCQFASRLRHMVEAAGNQTAVNMIPEFERCIELARPRWAVMENVVEAPTPEVTGYATSNEVIRDVWVGGETNRLRRFSFITREGYRLRIETAALHPVGEPTVLAGHGLAPSQRDKRNGATVMSLAETCRLQGLPEDFADALPFTTHGKRKVIGNGVPLPMGRAVARAVKAALTMERAA